MATHSSILVQRIPWTEEPGGYSPWARKEVDMTKRLSNAHAQMLLLLIKKTKTRPCWFHSRLIDHSESWKVMMSPLVSG